VRVGNDITDNGGRIMVVADVTIEKTKGLVNGYHALEFTAESLESSESESLVTPAEVSEVPQEDLKAPRTTRERSGQHQTNASSAAKVKPVPTKAAQRQSSAAPMAAPQTKAGRFAIKYVAQAELDREQAQLEKLSQAAMTGDTTALDALRAALDHCPHIWRRLADLELLVETKLIGFVAGSDPLRAEAFRKRCSELRQHLVSGKQGSLAVKLAASRVVSTWLFGQLLELRALESPQELRNIKQLEQAERRFQVAMRTFGMALQLELQLHNSNLQP
jgi:hypothetical protein